MSARHKRQKKQEVPSAPPTAKPPQRPWGVIIVLTLAAILVLVIVMAKSKKSSVASPVAFSSTAVTPAVGPIRLEDEKTVYAQYAGSSSCKECHVWEYETWKKSHHGLAERPVNLALDKEAFDPARTFKHGTQTSEVRLRNGHPEVVTLGFGGKKEPYTVERVIGYDPLRQFLISTTGGRMQTLEATYDPHKKEWFNVYGNEDRQPGEWGHWTGRGMNWNNMCAGCHNTRVRKNYDAASDSYHTAMAEMSVSCESCHGPMKQHAEWRKLYPNSSQPDPGLKHMSRDQMLDACAVCHARRMELTGDFEPGERFFDHFSLTIPDESEVFYPDGQIHDEDYEVTSFMSSKMYAAGVRCVDCHEPHSAKRALPGNLLCLRCHDGSYPQAPKIELTQHTFHKIDSTGSQCINCHMPQTTYMQRHHRHDHGFTIPDPLMTKEFGIPNACNKCHQDKDTAWSLAAVNKWYGEKMNRPTRERARTMAMARRGDDAARARLLVLLAGDEKPFWKAVGANMLERWNANPAVQDMLIGLTAHTNSLVRANAAQSLASLVGQNNQLSGPVQRVLNRLLDDPVRSVRYQAQWTLHGQLSADSQPMRELLQTIHYNADQPMGQMQFGMFEMDRQNQDAALAHFQKAMQWDPRSAAMHQELGTIYSMLNRPTDALAQMQEAVRLEPRNADMRYRLALAYNEVGQLAEATKELEETVKLDRRHARAWYNLGLAKNQLGQTDRALEALAKAETADPRQPEFPYAAATILVQKGRVEEAKIAARRALQIDPNYQPALGLLNSVNR